MPKKPSNRNELYAALVALTDEDNPCDVPPAGFKTVKQFEEDFDLGPKQTYVWMERLTKNGLAEKKMLRIRVGIYRREVPHYKLCKKAADIVRRIRSGRKPRGEA